jgi:hypothetical protein
MLRSLYAEEYQKAFAACSPAPAAAPIPRPDPDADDVGDWMRQLAEEEHRAQELLGGDYPNAPSADDDHPFFPEEDHPVGLLPPGSGLDPDLPPGAPPAPNPLRLHGINDGRAVPKDMSITRLREAIASGGRTDAALAELMVEVFSAAHRTGRYIPGDEPLLGTSICRFSAVDLSLDNRAPETAHRAHAKALQRAANEAFENHLLPLDRPCPCYSRAGRRSELKRCEFGPFRTRQAQIAHVHTHTLRYHGRQHTAGSIPPGVWHCFFDGCALTTGPDDLGRSTASTFPSKQAYLHHLYRQHRLSPHAAEPVHWCGICERFLESDQFGPEKERHFDQHWEEVWALVAMHGYRGQFDNGRRTIPSFCPFCLHDENLPSSERVSRTMDMNPAHYTLHIATHFAGADRDSLHQCPCFPRTCAYPETMTLEGLMHHLDDVHGLERSQVSSAVEQRGRKAKRAREIKSDRGRKRRATESD